MYATPSEFVRDLIREQYSRQEASEFREAIIEGYHDLAEGKVVEYKGSLTEALNRLDTLKD